MTTFTLGLVVDTHTRIWYLQQDSRLSKRAEADIDRALAAGHEIYVASISVVELVYLVDNPPRGDRGLAGSGDRRDRFGSGPAAGYSGRKDSSLRRRDNLVKLPFEWRH